MREIVKIYDRLDEYVCDYVLRVCLKGFFVFNEMPACEFVRV